MFENQDALSFIPISTAQKIMLGVNYVSLARVQIDAEENTDQAVADIRALLRDRHKLEKSEPDDFSIRAQTQAIEIFSSIRANFEHEISPVLLMDFGASRTKLSIVEFGMVKSHHTVNRGGADISDSISKSLDVSFSKAEEMKKDFGLFENPAEKSLADIIKTHIDYIFSETNDMLLKYEKRYDRTVSKVILSGGGSLLKGLKEMSSNNFKAEIETGHPFSKVGAPEFLNKVLSATGPEFAIALGLALRKLQ